MLLLIAFLACGEESSYQVSYGTDGKEGTQDDVQEESNSGSGGNGETSGNTSGNQSGGNTGGADAGTPDDPTDDPEGGPECNACGWFCTCEVGSSTPDDWHDCSVGYDCLDHCIDASSSPASEWFQCMMSLTGEDCDAVSECGYPEF